MITSMDIIFAWQERALKAEARVKELEWRFANRACECPRCLGDLSSPYTECPNCGLEFDKPK
jgi:hypothetical protein